MAEISEPLDLKRAARDRFAKVVATCAILTTLAGAVVGYLQSNASKAANQSSTDSQKLSIEAFGKLAKLKADGRVQFDLFIRSEVLRARAASALEQQLVGSPEDRSSLAEQRQRWLELAKAIDKRASEVAKSGGAAPLSSDPRFSPDNDPFFPARYTGAVVERRVSELQALRDAASREAGERGKQVSAYVAILALLAVSIYLFGFSLTPHGQENRAIFVTVAGTLSLVGLGWALTVAASPASRAPPAAARAGALGDEALLVQNWTLAKRFYDRAIELDPAAGHYYFGRGQAEFFGGSPESVTVGAALTSTEALRKTVADADRALELGSKDYLLLGNAGYQKMLLGARADSEELIQQGLEMTREAARQPQAQPFYLQAQTLYSYNVAFGSLLLGDRIAAHRAYRRAIKLSLDQGPDLTAGLVAVALTELEQLEPLRGAAGRTMAQGFKEEIVRRTWGAGKGADPTPAPAESASLALTPSLLELSLDRFPWATQDRVVVAWYRYAPKLGWYALPNAVALTSGGQSQSAWYSDSSGRVFVRRYQLRDVSPPTCLGPGLYKAEVYVNGRLTLTKTHRSHELPALTPAFDRSIGYRLCRPSDWRPAPKALPGLVNGFVNQDQSEGVYVFKLSTPLEDESAIESDPGAYVANRIGPVLARLSFILPPRPPLVFSQPTFFGGIPGEWGNLYADAHRFMGAYGGIAAGNSLLIGVVFGPRGQAERLLKFTGESITEHQ